MNRLRGLGVSLTVASIGILLAAGPASATMLFHDRYAGTDAFSYDCAGVNVDVEVEFSGTAHIRVGKGKDAGAFFLHDNFSYRETHTSETGAVLFISGNGLFQETRATRVEGTVFTFSSHESGQPFTVTDEDGTVLIRDRGSIRETILFDTLGDDTPGGVFIELIERRFSGPHPGANFDTCSLLG